MIYAQFYQRSAIAPEMLIEACGDRAVIILDGRVKAETNRKIAAEECRRRGYVAWQIFRGETFTRSRPVSGIWPVNNQGTVKNPAWLSAHSM